MRLGLAIFSLTLLVAAGCGDDDGDETTPAVETTPPAETQPEPPPPTRPEQTVPDEEPPADDGDSSGGGAEAPPGDEDAGDGAITAPGNCGRVAFEHGTDSGASGIQAVGVDCESARALARAAGDHGDDLAYEWRGFECAGARRDEPPVPMVDWVCLRNPNELVKFSSS